MKRREGVDAERLSSLVRSRSRSRDLCRTTELGARFRQIATTEGVPAAVRWRSAQFKE